MPDLSSLFSTFSFLPRTLSLAAFWASKGYCRGWLPAWTPADNSACLGLPLSLQSHRRVPAGVLTACQEGPEAGGQAEAGDTAAAAQGSISFPSSGPLGQRKPRQEGRAATSREAYKAPPTPAILPQSLSILYLHLAPFLGHAF